MTEKEKIDIIEKIAEAPAVALDTTLTKTEQVAHNLPRAKTVKRTKQYWNILGPGLTTGAADDDPSGIVTYSTVGAGFGYSALWMALICLPLMLSIQFICAKR